MKLIKLLRQSSSGVTLLELILVMTILAVGTAIAVPKMQGAYWRRQMDRMAGGLQTTGDAIRLYQMDYAPNETLPWAITNHQATNVATRAVLLTLEQKGYLKRVELPIRRPASLFCYIFNLDANVYTMKIYPMNPPGSLSTCNFSSPDFFWFSMDLQAGRAEDKKGMGTTIVLTRRNNPDSF